MAISARMHEKIRAYRIRENEIARAWYTKYSIPVGAKDGYVFFEAHRRVHALVHQTQGQLCIVNVPS